MWHKLKSAVSFNSPPRIYLLIFTVAFYLYSPTAGHVDSNPDPHSFRIKSDTVSRGCATCHPVHNADDRDALIKKPSRSTGTFPEAAALSAASRLCLSCHSLSGMDYNSIRGYASFRQQHPVGVFLSGDSTKTTSDSGLNLDSSGRIQCTTCHNPHKNKYGNYLVIDNSNGALCLSCHTFPAWRTSPHAYLSTNSTGNSEITTRSACSVCHEIHTGFNHLLRNQSEVTLCQRCHPKSPGEMPSHTRTASSLSKPTRQLRIQTDRQIRKRTFTSCSDCHDPHAGVVHNRRLMRQ